MTDTLKQAFAEAVNLVAQWREDQLQPAIELNGVRLTVSKICMQLRACKDPLPETLITQVIWLTGQPRAKYPLRTYLQAARRLREFVQEMIADGYEGDLPAPWCLPIGAPLARLPAAKKRA